MTRRQIKNQWSSGIVAHLSRLRKISSAKSTGKFLASFFWDQDGILLLDYLQKGQTINAEYYSSLLVQLKEILKEKRPARDTTTPWLTRHLQPRKNRPTWASNVLNTTLFSGSGPVGLSP